MKGFRSELERAERSARRQRAYSFRGQRGGGFFGGNRIGAAPALFLAGQSNAGNQDGTPGTTDARVSLTWTLNGTVFTGPAPMALQAGGHSFEWQCSTNMALHFNSNIIVAKYWADGSLVSQWQPGQAFWTPLALALENFALQVVAAGVTQVEFGWCQGESNTPNNQTSTIPTFQSDTSALFDAVKYLLEGYGLHVHFTIIETNINIVTGPNPSDPSAANLAAVRQAQVNLGVVRNDTTLLSLDSIVPGGAGGVHYINGQTNTGGALWELQLAGRYTNPQPVLLTPPTVEDIMGASVTFDYDSRSIVGLNNNDPVVSWPDLGPGGHTSLPVGTARPLYKTAALGAIPEVEFDGVNDTAPVPGVALAAPGTLPIFSIWVGRQKSWTLNNRVFGSTVGFNLSVYQSDVSPKLSTSNASGSFGPPGIPLINAFAKVENQYSHSAGDYMQVQNTRAITGDLGNNAPGAVAMALTNGGGFGNVAYLRWMIFSAIPSQVQRDKLRGYGFKNYGGSVWGAT